MRRDNADNAPATQITSKSVQNDTDRCDIHRNRRFPDSRRAGGGGGCDVVGLGHACYPLFSITPRPPHNGVSNCRWQMWRSALRILLTGCILMTGRGVNVKDWHGRGPGLQRTAHCIVGASEDAAVSEAVALLPHLIRPDDHEPWGVVEAPFWGGHERDGFLFRFRWISPAPVLRHVSAA